MTKRITSVSMPHETQRSLNLTFASYFGLLTSRERRNRNHITDNEI